MLYFFDCYVDGRSATDSEGIKLEAEADPLPEALLVLAELVRDEGGAAVSVVAMNNDGDELFTVSLVRSGRVQTLSP